MPTTVASDNIRSLNVFAIHTHAHIHILIRATFKSIAETCLRGDLHAANSTVVLYAAELDRKYDTARRQCERTCSHNLATCECVRWRSPLVSVTAVVVMVNTYYGACCLEFIELRLEYLALSLLCMHSGGVCCMVVLLYCHIVATNRTTIRQGRADTAERRMSHHI